MRLIDKQGREVKTGDIVWRGRKSYVFLDIRNQRVDVVSTDERRFFVSFEPKDLNLKLEAVHETSNSSY